MLLLLLLLLHAVTDVTDNGPLSTSSHLMLAGKLRTMTDFVNRNTDWRSLKATNSAP